MGNFAAKNGIIYQCFCSFVLSFEPFGDCSRFCWIDQGRHQAQPGQNFTLDFY